MAKPNTRDLLVDEDVAEDGQEQEVQQVVVSDSRARRKRKRGEVVEKASETDAAITGKKDRPTPGRRAKTATKATTSTSFIQRIPVVRSVYNYFVAAYVEMTKVTWPTREETIHLTRLVLVVTIAFSIGLGVFDVFYSWWFRQALDNDVVFLGIGVLVLLAAGGITYFVWRQEEPTQF